MDDQSSSQNGGDSGQLSSLVSSSNCQGDDNSQQGGVGGNSAIANTQQQYSIPGILHFIQHEWVRFEHERSQWDVDRAELQARIAILVGERKSQESLKCDLIRRIKMLEYALKQERAKFHRLKYGCDPPNMNSDDLKQPPGGDADQQQIEKAALESLDPPPFSMAASNMTWRQGRQLLQQYLVEIGYTDNILDVRSNRVRSLLGLNQNNNSNNNNNNNLEDDLINGGDNNNQNNNKKNELQRMRAGTPSKKASSGPNSNATTNSLTEAMILDSEAAVMANFEFLANTDVEMSDEDEANENDMDLTHQEHHDDDLGKRKNNKIIINEDDVDAEAEEVLNELNMLTGGSGAVEAGDGGQNLVLGELAQLTVNNEAENSYDAGGNTKESFRKLWCAKFTLRSHFDSVRALTFHPQDPVLITASDDHTLKFWNIHKTVPAKKSPSLDVEPLYTFRAHTGPVLCVAMSGTGEYCYSGGLDSAIHCWKLPNSYIDPYDSYDPSVLKATLEGHSDAVWGLATNNTKGYLVSFSADSTVKLWSPQAKTPLLNTIEFPGPDGTLIGPTSVDFARDEVDKIVVAYKGNQLVTFDTETGKQILKFDSSKTLTTTTTTTTQAADQKAPPGGDKLIYKVVSHPTFPVTITAHQDRHIRFWDTNNGTLIHSMVAHLDAVTSLAVDPKGLYLLSGSHDNSIRLWNLDNKTCIQEITAHRKKFDESILDVAFHPTRGYIASGGADSLAKVFV